MGAFSSAPTSKSTDQRARGSNRAPSAANPRRWPDATDSGCAGARACPRDGWLHRNQQDGRVLAAGLGGGVGGSVGGCVGLGGYLGGRSVHPCSAPGIQRGSRRGGHLRAGSALQLPEFTEFTEQAGGTCGGRAR